MARKAKVEGGIVRVHVKKVESHGKAGATDGSGNVPTFAIKAAIESGELLDPGTREPDFDCFDFILEWDGMSGIQVVFDSLIFCRVLIV